MKKRQPRKQKSLGGNQEAQKSMTGKSKQDLDYERYNMDYDQSDG